MKKIILHFGVHRTGTTHLQENLKLNSNYLKSNSIIYFRFHEYKELYNRAYFLRNNIDKINNQEVEFFKEKVNEIINGYEIAIISYEGLLGELNLNNDGSIYPNAITLLQFYKQVFEEYETIAVVSVRNYSEFILSTYKYELKNGGCKLTFSQYLAGITNIENSWTRLIQSVNSVFPNSIVWKFENYKNDQKKHLIDLLLLSNKNIKEEEIIFDKRKKNTSSPLNSINVYYKINKIFPNSRFGKITSALINKQIDKYKLAKYFKAKSDCIDIDETIFLKNDYGYYTEFKK